jgi:alkane 1-monooxygenase
MLLKALPFALTFVQAPLILMAALHGGLWIAGPFVWGWVVVSLLDKAMGLDTANLDPATADEVLFWHKLVTWGWVPVQMALIVTCLWAVSIPGHLDTGAAFGVFAALGVGTGGIGFTFAHEMIHQRNRWERRAGELLLISVGYGHFATEHVHGHHLTVATPRDPVSARKGQSFYAFFVRAVGLGIISAWRIERVRLARRGRPVWHRTNPFWRYGVGLAGFVALSWAIAGPFGVALFAFQCFIAVYQLEGVNYVEHYGLTRRYLGGGRFERVGTQHSWNAAHTVSNWMLINLQRHSDHHYRPDRRFPLLQHHPWKQAPQLPFSYPFMIWLSLMPPLWFRVMDRRVERWRARFYPDITDWSAYENGTIGRNTAPAGALPA